MGIGTPHSESDDRSHVQVECYAGSRYPERPTAFIWKSVRHEVASVEWRWRTPGGVGFRVRTAEGEYFNLFYSERENRWTIRT